MPSVVMKEPNVEVRPRTLARITGAIYLLYFVTAIFSFIVSSKPPLSLIANLVSIALYITLTALLYYLFDAVNKSLALVAAVISLGGCTVQVLRLFQLIPASISPLLFFGPYCLLIGYLILRSMFLPHVLGAAMVLAGFAWLIFILPPAAHYLSRYIEVVGFVAELSLCLWLLIFGVNEQRWMAQHCLRHPVEAYRNDL